MTEQTWPNPLEDIGVWMQKLHDHMPSNKAILVLSEQMKDHLTRECEENQTDIQREFDALANRYGFSEGCEIRTPS